MLNFKEAISKQLPQGYTLYQLYALSDSQTRIEGINGSIKTFFELTKVDLTDYFQHLPTLSLPAGSTVNDLYAKLSAIYDLGLEQNVDYYNVAVVNPSSNARYMELPLSHNSYGYKGVLRCYVILDAFTGLDLNVERDVSSVDIGASLDLLKFRNFLMGSIIEIEETKFVATSLSLEFVTAIIDRFIPQVKAESLALCKGLLSGARVVDKYADDFSDIVVIISSGELFQIRYQESLKNNDTSDNTSDNSQGLPDTGDESSAENPVSGEGDLNTGEQSEHPYPSLPTEGSDDDMDEIEIEIE